MILYIGTQSEQTASEGIYWAELDERTGALQVKGSVRNKNNPMYLCLDGTWLYSADHPENEGGVSVYRLEGAQPRYVRSVWVHQEKTCYVLAFKEYLLLANYGSGSISLLSRKDDSVQFLENKAFVGNGPHPDQPHSRIHCIRQNGLGSVFATDLGGDRLYLLDVCSDRIRILDHLQTSPGIGPRHMAADVDKQRVYVLGELKNTIVVANYTRNTLEKVAEIPIYDVPVPSAGSEILLDRECRHLYTANRGDNTISIFTLQNGLPELVGRVPCGGVHPRHMAYVAGRYVLVSNMHSNQIAVFECVGDTLQQRFDLPIPGPSCVIEGDGR